MAVIPWGLIGLSMYVTEKTGYVGHDEENGLGFRGLRHPRFHAEYTVEQYREMPNGDDILYTVNYDVFKDGEFVDWCPTVQLLSSPRSSRSSASVITFLTEDLFVVYKGVNTNGDFLHGRARESADPTRGGSGFGPADGGRVDSHRRSPARSAAGLDLAPGGAKVEVR